MFCPMCRLHCTAREYAQGQRWRGRGRGGAEGSEASAAPQRNHRRNAIQFRFRCVGRERGSERAKKRGLEIPDLTAACSALKARESERAKVGGEKIERQQQTEHLASPFVSPLACARTCSGFPKGDAPDSEQTHASRSAPSPAVAELSSTMFAASVSLQLSIAARLCLACLWKPTGGRFAALPGRALFGCGA